MTVVVLSWNGREDTLACLRSLAAATYPRLEVIVVDNGSSDGSADAVAAAHPDLVLIPLDANLGFAGGMNVGIAEALSRGAGPVMLLNNDTVVEPGFVEPLVDALESRSDASAACSQIVFRDDPARSGMRGRPSGRDGAITGPITATVGRESPRRHLRSSPIARAVGRCWCPRLHLRSSATSTSRCSRTPRTRTGRCDPLVPGDEFWSSRRASSGMPFPPRPGGASSPDTLYYSLRNGLVVAERWAPLGPLRTRLRRGEAVAAHLAQALRSGRRRAGVRAVYDGWRDLRAGRLGPRHAA